MTDNSDKIRSIVLAALMVFSVFAGTVALTGTAAAANAEPVEATQYHESGSSGSAVIEIAFNTSITDSQDDIVVHYADGTEENVSNPTVNNGRIEIGVTYNSSTESVTVPGSYVGGDNASIDVTNAPVTVQADSGNTGQAVVNETAYIGSNVAVVAPSNGETFDFSGEYTPTRGTGDNSQVYVIDTDGLEEGNIEVDASNDGDVNANIELSSLGLTVDAANTTSENALTATVEADDINRDINAVLLDSDGEEVETVEGEIGSSGTTTVDFGAQDAGDYTVVVTDVDTQVEAEDSLTVSEADESQATFTQNTYEVAQGGIAEITVELDATTEGTLVVGDQQDDGYQANVTFTDENEDGEVTIQFNTYNAGAGSTGSGVVSAAGDDTAELNSADTGLGDSLLGQGGYNIAVDTGHAANGSEVTTSGDADFGSLAIGERSTDSMTLWTAPSGAESDELLASATEDDTIASGDWVVHQVEATGLEGLVDGDLSAAFGNGVNLTVTQTAETTRQNRDPKTLNVTEAQNDGDIALISDAENGSYYIALDTSTEAFERGSAENLSANAGEGYTATFTVDDSKLVGDEEGAHESVNSTFEVVTGTATLDTTPVEVTASEDAEITGTSTLAPGSEIRLVVESSGDTTPRFYNNPTAVVQDDGTWNVTVDFSEQAAGDTFTVSSGDYFSADGEVVESVGTPTATDAPETDTATPTATATETAAPETDTAAPETETDEPDTTTTTTPGFGVAVALVALLAAALLAGRRE